MRPSCPALFPMRRTCSGGCQTKVWLSVTWEAQVPNIQVTSDSMLLRGVGLVLMRLLNGLPLEEYRELDRWDIPAAMGLSEMFTSQRQQGITALLREIQRQIQEKTACE